MAKKRKRKKKLIIGHLDSLSLSEIIQILCLGARTASVTLHDGNRQGRIWLEAGAAVHAESGALTGEEAFYNLLGWPTGEFSIENQARTRKRSLERDTMFLVMEGLRLIDESTAEASPYFETDTDWFVEAEPAEVTASAPQPAARVRKTTAIGRPGRVLGFAIGAGIAALLLLGTVLFLGLSEPELTEAVEPAIERFGPGSPLGLPPELMTPFDLAALVTPTEKEEVPKPKKQPVVVAKAPEKKPEPVAAPPPPPPPPPPPSYLEIETRSSVKAGLLTLFLDGEEVFVQDLASEEARIVGGGLVKQRLFETTLTLDPGEHELTARVVRTKGDRASEQMLVIDIEPGRTQRISLVAKRRTLEF